MPDQGLPPLRLSVPGVDPDRMMLADIDTSAGPLFSIGGISKLLGAPVDTMRNRIWTGLIGQMVLPGQPAADGSVCDHWRLYDPDGRLLGRRTAGGHLRYTLSDAELMVHAMLGHDVIDGQRAALMLAIIGIRAALAGYLPLDHHSLGVSSNKEMP